MLYLLLGLAVFVGAAFSYKYFRLKESIRLVAESLATRTTILSHSKEFKGSDKNWHQLIDELNALIGEVGRLSRQSSGQLNQIETTLGSLQEGVVIIDRDNYVLLANEASQGLFPQLGVKIGQRIEGAVRSPDFLQFVWDFKKGMGLSKKEVAFERDGQESWIEITGARLYEPTEGRGPWFLFVLHDISLLKKLENARKLFVANASHELKTPVAVIKGYAETLVSDHETMAISDRARFLDTIHRHSERLSLLITDLLSLSRLESEAQVFDWREQDILGWLRNVARDYVTSSFRDKNVSLRVCYDEDAEALVRFDSSKLRQVFDNLMENAAKYSGDNAEVEFGSEKREGEIRLWVEDSGCGVPSADLRRIFERFYRVDKGRSRETGGTGLGLSIVKHIVEGHGGKVWAETGQRGGLRVMLSLPLIEANVSNTA